MKLYFYVLSLLNVFFVIDARVVFRPLGSNACKDPMCEIEKAFNYQHLFTYGEKPEHAMTVFIKDLNGLSDSYDVDVAGRLAAGVALLGIYDLLYKDDLKTQIRAYNAAKHAIQLVNDINQADISNAGKAYIKSFSPEKPKIPTSGSPAPKLYIDRSLFKSYDLSDLLNETGQDLLEERKAAIILFGKFPPKVQQSANNFLSTLQSTERNALTARISTKSAGKAAHPFKK